MPNKSAQLINHLSESFPTLELDQNHAHEITLSCTPDVLFDLMTHLKTHEACQFNQLIDCCGVDFLHYGTVEWETDHASHLGFSRAAFEQDPAASTWEKSRFATVYHLLSITLNQRIRVMCMLDDTQPTVPSAVSYTHLTLPTKA